MSINSAPETWWTVTPHQSPDEEYGPFATYEEARQFAILRFVMRAKRANITECRMRVVGSEEITAEEFERLRRNPPRGYLINADDAALDDRRAR